MAQWDVYANPSPRSRDEVPYVVVLQSALLDGLATRLVMPLSRTDVASSRLPGRLAPQFDIDGVRVVPKPHQTAYLPASELRRPVTSLRRQSHLLVDALDAVVSGV
jgi:toxin CcdB